ncbi:MAG: aminoacyl-tRNA hydrolase [Gammaproteobacteria bacterium]|nr:aminoacyl-tRNA hydrolase [Gammaproteobacteria bacterium]
MLKINSHIIIPENEIDIQAIRAQGSGGQNVNKVSSAIHLRFDIAASSLPDMYKGKLLALNDQRVSTDGIIVIKAQQYRSQEQNKADALLRLQELIIGVGIVRKKRKATKPTKSSQTRRMDSKTKHGKLKSLRRKTDD